MKLNMTVDLHLKDKEVKEAVAKAAKLAMRDTVVSIWNDSTKNTPKLTGHNARALVGEVSGMGDMKGSEAKPSRVVDDSKLEGAVYSTSGYGGYIETGTTKMTARPYIKPAADKYVPKFPGKVKEHLGD